MLVCNSRHARQNRYLKTSWKFILDWKLEVTRKSDELSVYMVVSTMIWIQFEEESETKIPWSSVDDFFFLIIIRKNSFNSKDQYKILFLKTKWCSHQIFILKLRLKGICFFSQPCTWQLNEKIPRNLNAVVSHLKLYKSVQNSVYTEELVLYTTKMQT